MINASTKNVVFSSFRDPSGFVFKQDNLFFRQINTIYKKHYDHLIDSGLYDTLVAENLLIAHSSIDHQNPPEQVYKIIKPEIIPFISYPYEWTFSQLRDTALATLTIQKKALEYGMSLKDSSAYNIQFIDGKPILIDTLSFEKYSEGKPWIAYRQFCQHFLAPLTLMAYTDVRLNSLLRGYVDGIPLDLASKLLPFRTKLKFSLLSHIHLHAYSQKYFSNKIIETKQTKMTRFSFLALIDSLYCAIDKLRWKPQGTEWGDYDKTTNYSDEARKHKRQIVSELLAETNTKNVWDCGGNTGFFSRVASEQGIPTISFDVDPVAVEKNYLIVKNQKEKNLLPLVLDLTNPSPGLGWSCQERMSLFERGSTDTIFALALIHHLVISNNLSFSKIVEFFAGICRNLIIEFIPKDDSKVTKMLQTRMDVFPHYSKKYFEHEFSKKFKIRRTININHSKRTIYLMSKK